MPVEVRELVIRTRIEANRPASPGLTETELQELKHTLVARCVERVLEALEQRAGR